MKDNRNPNPAPSFSGKSYGLIAGWGNYPLVLARAMKKAGYRVVCLGALGHADPKLAEICDVYRVMGLAKFGAACRFFRKNGVSEATMAGKIFKKNLLQKGVIWRQLPDLYTLSVFFPHFLSKKTDLKDDSLLLTVTKAFENRGIRLCPGSDLAPEILVRRGLLTKETPTPSEWEDIRLAWPLTREIGRLDFGQDVMVKDRRVLAVEGIDGTDETIIRAGTLCPEGGFTIVKIGKPGQDMRFDVPTIGFGTLEKMSAAGANLLAVEAGKTICVEPQEELAKEAERRGIRIVGLNESDLASESFPFTDSSGGIEGGMTEEGDDLSFSAGKGKKTPLDDRPWRITPLTRRRPTASREKDLRFGAPVVETLAPYRVGRTVTIRERAVLAVEAAEGMAETIRRTGRITTAGFTVFCSGSPSFPLDPIPLSILDVMKSAKGKVLALPPDYPIDKKDTFLARADHYGIAVVEIAPIS